jgi:endo-1,4-beta-xylanase
MKNNPFFKKEIKNLSKGIMKGALSLSAVSILLLASCSKDEVSAPASEKSNSRIISSSGYVNESGRYISNNGQLGGGYYYSFWANGNDNRPGNFATFTNGSGGNFAINFGQCWDAVGGKGWKPGSNQSIGYNVGYVTSMNFVGVYGWTTNPLIEYYVVEKGYIPANTVNWVNADGHTYTFGTHLQVNQPNIIGQGDFWQYIDNWGGQNFNGNKTITMNTHIKNWKARGGHGFGSYDYQVFGAEGYDYNTGNAGGYMNATVWHQ